MTLFGGRMVKVLVEWLTSLSYGFEAHHVLMPKLVFDRLNSSIFMAKK